MSLGTPHLKPVDAPIDTSRIAARVRACHNFRFGDQFFVATGINLSNPEAIRSVHDCIVSDLSLHSFLRGGEGDGFQIRRLRDKCETPRADALFVDTLASASNDRLGDFARFGPVPTASERAEVAALFGSLGAFAAFAVTTGLGSFCECGNPWHHQFTTWFHGIGIDYCFLVAWPERDLVWIGCWSDID